MVTGSFDFFFFNDTATTEIYTLSLHDALPICRHCKFLNEDRFDFLVRVSKEGYHGFPYMDPGLLSAGDRKSTRLNSSHLVISYAVFCLKKKKHDPRYCHAVKDLIRLIPDARLL